VTKAAVSRYSTGVHDLLDLAHPSRRVQAGEDAVGLDGVFARQPLRAPETARSCTSRRRLPDILSAVIDDVVELALVGAGRMGRMHLQALDPAGGRAHGVRVTDVVEPVEAARKPLRDTGYRVHDTLADLLATRRPDGVLVAAPTDRHAHVSRTALGAGIPVLCEKPAGSTWQEVEETGRVAADHGAAFQVAYWRRFVPALVALRERIAAGELGQVLHVVCAQWDGAPPPAPFRSGGSTSTGGR
jgi:predicted dehydrogenase